MNRQAIHIQLIGHNLKNENMKTKIITTISLSLIISAFNCKKIGRETIQLQNNSLDTVYTFVAWNGMEHIYPDTTLPTMKPGMRFVPPEKKRVFIETGSGGNWDQVFFNLPSDTLSIYLFSADTLATYNWSEIHDKYLILKRYDLSLQDLKNSNFIITYP
jgi:hypothetical protein